MFLALSLAIGLPSLLIPVAEPTRWFELEYIDAEDVVLSLREIDPELIVELRGNCLSISCDDETGRVVAALIDDLDSPQGTRPSRIVELVFADPILVAGILDELFSSSGKFSCYPVEQDGCKILQILGDWDLVEEAAELALALDQCASSTQAANSNRPNKGWEPSPNSWFGFRETLAVFQG